MGLLNEEQKMDMVLAHGKMFYAVCDEKDCGKLIKMGEMFVILKYKRKKWIGRPHDRPCNWNARVPYVIRCLDCDAEAHGRVRGEVIVKGRNKKKKGKSLTEDEAAKINPIVKKVVLRLLKKHEKVEAAAIKGRVLVAARKKQPKIKKSEVNNTLRMLRKAKVVRVKEKHWSLVGEKK